MRKKRITAAAIAAIMTAGQCLAGCSGKTAQAVNPEPAAATAAQTETAQTEPVTQTYTTEEKTDGKTTFILVTNPGGGAVLSYAKDSGVALLEVSDGGVTYAFKDMDKDGELDPFEDWRLDIDTRARDLAGKLTKEQIAGLMLFSYHERSPEEGLTEAQKQYLKEDELRNVLNAGGNNIEATVKWNNEMQAYVEGLGGTGIPVIPVNYSSDPRSTASADDMYQVDGNEISLWPSNLGLAATFSPETVFEFGRISSEEYRGLGISTALGPQIDLATDPRWPRFNGTFGENTLLTTEMTEAYVNGTQSTFDKDGSDLGWGAASVNAMIKHFPGDGSGEGGRESHTNAGKYAVYPGDNFDELLKPFIEGGLKLTGKTGQTASVMSSYSVGIGADGEAEIGVRMPSAYNKAKMDILRVDNNYDGVICTDWMVTTAMEDGTGPIGTGWLTADMTVPERHYEVLKTGTDMFGGNNDKAPVLAAYDLWEADFKAGNNPISAAERFAQSGKRIATVLLQTGLFEHPYLDLEHSKAVVASGDKVAAGYQAQLDSIVMLKNKNKTIKASGDILADYKDKIVYIPSSILTEFPDVFSPEGAEVTGETMSLEAARLYFKDVVTDEAILDSTGDITGYKTPDLSGIDLAIVGMRTPNNGSLFAAPGLDETGFYPLSLQYRPYTADGGHVRRTSIAGDVRDDGTKENRSYFNAVSRIGNEYDLDACLNTVKAVEAAEAATGRDIPVVVAMKSTNPVIMGEFEAQVDAIVVGFSVSDKAFFEVILGGHEPQGLLPMQFPKDMDTVEAQLEDVGQDMIPYTDAEGNHYDFAYGLNYDGVISDQRTAKYK